jgi:hypothetical protein
MAFATVGVLNELSADARRDPWWAKRSAPSGCSRVKSSFPSGLPGDVAGISAPLRGLIVPLLLSQSLFPPGTGGPFAAEGGHKGRKKGLVRGSSLKIGLRRFGRTGVAEMVRVRRPQDPPAPAVVA